MEYMGFLTMKIGGYSPEMKRIKTQQKNKTNK
jgi:hypothetical protein